MVIIRRKALEWGHIRRLEGAVLCIAHFRALKVFEVSSLPDID